MRGLWDWAWRPSAASIGLVAVIIFLGLQGRAIRAESPTGVAPASPTSVAPASNPDIASVAPAANPDVASGGYTGPNDPNLQACQAARGDCNPAALAIIKANNPPYQPPSVNPQYLSRAAVEEAARRGARTPLTPEAPPSAIVYSVLMPRSQFLAFTHEAGNPNLDTSRLEWVITVHAPMATDGSPGTPMEIKPVYSVALDAETGQWTDGCIGCAWLDHS